MYIIGLLPHSCRWLRVADKFGFGFLIFCWGIFYLIRAQSAFLKVEEFFRRYDDGLNCVVMLLASGGIIIWLHLRTIYPEECFFTNFAGSLNYDLVLTGRCLNNAYLSVELVHVERIQYFYDRCGWGMDRDVWMVYLWTFLDRGRQILKHWAFCKPNFLTFCGSFLARQPIKG